MKAERLPGMMDVISIENLRHHVQALVFDRSPYPDMDFDLSLEGIEDAGKPVSTPMIHFKKASAWMFGMFP